MKDINIEIGSRLKDRRLKLGMTQEVLAEKISVSPQFIADVERGKKGMSLSTVATVCNALLVSSDFLIFGRREPQGEIIDLVKYIDEKNIVLVQDILLAIIKNQK